MTEYSRRLSRLKDRVAVVAGGGGSNSIGRAIAHRYAEEGAKVAVLDVNWAGAARVAGEIKARSGTAIAISCDVTELSQCEAAAEEVAGTFGGRIDILVNNAAFFGSGKAWKPFDECTPEEWDQTQDVNVRGMWFCARAVVPYMKAQRYGKIINLASSTFFEGVAGLIHYTTSKGAVIGLTRALGRELGEFGIRVNALAPGFTVTDAQKNLSAEHPEWFDLTRQRQALNGRNELPEDLAGPAFFLASEDSDFMTCQTLLVDGGGTPH